MSATHKFYWVVNGKYLFYMLFGLILISSGICIYVFKICAASLNIAACAFPPSSMTCNFNLIWPLQAVKKGDTIFIGQYLFTGNETTSVWLEVSSFIGACHATYFSC